MSDVKLTEVRPMTGFLATLTESQKEAALAYRGAAWIVWVEDMAGDVARAGLRLPAFCLSACEAQAMNPTPLASSCPAFSLPCRERNGNPLPLDFHFPGVGNMITRQSP